MMPNGWFNGEREFYRAGAVTFSDFRDPGGLSRETSRAASAATQEHKPADKLTDDEKATCAKMGLSHESFVAMRDNCVSLSRI